ncbi:immunoglobulin domain-containing family protein [Brevibacillus massiliensis]|uniref:hypothetical protein n=1 Tax=Brevibacillus massiliensis TaxID=1118054 RepID=UPI00164E9E17|nr:hypothetical protein [Brevibacillus massiliensis]
MASLTLQQDVEGVKPISGLTLLCLRGRKWQEKEPASFGFGEHGGSEEKNGLASFVARQLEAGRSLHFSSFSCFWAYVKTPLSPVCRSEGKSGVCDFVTRFPHAPPE